MRSGTFFCPILTLKKISNTHVDACTRARTYMHAHTYTHMRTHTHRHTNMHAQGASTQPTCKQGQLKAVVLGVQAIHHQGQVCEAVGQQLAAVQPPATAPLNVKVPARVSPSPLLLRRLLLLLMVLLVLLVLVLGLLVLLVLGLLLLPGLLLGLLWMPC